jgi:hypothetical protein
VAYLTRALLDLQPAGPFCQVDNEQAIALRILANIFGAAKLESGKEKLTHQDEVENNAPQRVQTTVINYITTLNTQFASKATDTSQTSSYTTNTSWYGATKRKTTTFVSRHDV